MIPINEPTTEERLSFFSDRVYSIAKQMGIETYVMVAMEGTKSVITRFPDCAPDCGDEDACSKKVFREAEDMLKDLVEKIESGEAKMEPNTPIDEEA